MRDFLDFLYFDERVCEAFSSLPEEEWTFEYAVLGGLAKQIGSAWIACENEESAVFFKKICEGLTPPGSNGKYKYKVYNADEKPFRYCRARVPERYWRDSKDKLERTIKASNQFIIRKYKDETTGEMKSYHFRLVSGMEDKTKDLEGEGEKAHFWVQIEIDEKLFKTLIELQGKLKLGVSYLFLQGSGMVKAAKQGLISQLQALTEEMDVSASN